jgi:hypothetical protein
MLFGFCQPLDFDFPFAHKPYLADLFIFSSGLNACHLAMRRRDGQGDGPAAYAAIFNVLLAPDRAVNDHFDLLPTVRALDECSLKTSHGLA